MSEIFLDNDEVTEAMIAAGQQIASDITDASVSRIVGEPTTWDDWLKMEIKNRDLVLAYVNNEIVGVTAIYKAMQRGKTMEMLRQHELPASCTWKPDEDGNWETTCGQMHVFFDGTPHQNSYGFCPYCGRQLMQTDEGEHRKDG